jgi:osomolarity two-component system, sensor histidine kinase NIK1
LTKRINVDVRGEILALKETVNFMTESLNVVAAKVTRVAKEVGTDGNLGGEASVDDIGGAWKVGASLSKIQLTVKLNHIPV